MALLDTVLIIDDEIDLCVLLSLYFKKRQVHVTCVNSLAEATKILPSLRPTLIFIDNNLPDGFGIHLIPAIKKNLPTAIIIVTTGYNADLINSNALSLGADVFMDKPYSLDQVGEVLNRFKAA